MSQLGGGFRQQRWCEFFLERGYSVRLFYLHGAFTVTWQDVATVAELREKREFWVSNAPPISGVRDSRQARFARWVKHSFMIDLFLPSVFLLLLTLHRHRRRAKQRVVLLASSPPFAIGVVGRFMKLIWGQGIIFSLDMRDLWALHSAFPGWKRQKLPVERWVTCGADVFTTVSVGLRERFEAAYGKSPIVAYNVATHALPIPGSRLTNFSWTALDVGIKPHTLKLVYTGSIPDGFYDLDLLIGACEKIERNVDGDVALQMIFVGAGRHLQDRIRKRNIPNDLMIFVPQMSHDRVAAIQTAADVLLFLGYKSADNQGQVSIKLFEYFKRQIPILPISIKPGSDVDQLLMLYCGKSLYLNSEENIARALSDLTKGKTTELPQAVNPSSDSELMLTYEKVAIETLEKMIEN